MLPSDPHAPLSPDWVLVYRGPGSRGRELALVLEAVGIRARRSGTRWRTDLWVAAADAERATGELAAYLSENESWPPLERTEPARVDGVVSALVYGLVLAAVFWLDKRAVLEVAWWDAGRTQAAAIRAGEWWRAITALTLHVNLAHLASNLFFGGFFGVLVCRAVGVGAGWSSILLAGATGNLLNAFLQPAAHSSVGASTAVFGAIGILTTYYWRLRHRLGQRRLRRWGPLLAGAVLLNWLGAGGERTDVAGHCCGMVTGLVLGIVLGAAHRRGHLESHRRHGVLALAPLLVLTLSWVRALWP